jgi:hypothetical protein
MQIFIEHFGRPRRPYLSLVGENIEDNQIIERLFWESQKEDDHGPVTSQFESINRTIRFKLETEKE